MRAVASCEPGCRCIICLELEQQQPPPSDRMAAGPIGCNFILRRALPFVSREPSREWLEEAGSEPELADYELGSTLPEQPQPSHKTVIYFGDTNPREPQPHLVVSVKPGREDVIRIEQDETRIDDYWSLPGDTTGFKADWSFVQQWRLRGANGGSRELCCNGGGGGGVGGVKEPTTKLVAERDTDSVGPTTTPTHHQQHHQHQQPQLRTRRFQPAAAAAAAADCGGSSSDENRSSGHASMSDTGGHTSSGSPPQRALLSVPEDGALQPGGGLQQQQQPRQARGRSQQTRGAAKQLQLACPGSGLDDIKLAIAQLTMRSHSSSLSTYSSLSSRASGGAGPARLMRHSSLETVNTNVTSADEFVWVDSHNRLVELQQLPWTQHDVLRVLQQGRGRELMRRVSCDAVPRLSYLLQRALVRLARETQRLARPLGLCSKHHVYSAFNIVLCPALADSCTKACLRAAAMYAVSSVGSEQLKQSKSSRSGLQLPVGRFLRWMSDVRLGRMVHEYAALYLAAGMENLLEEILIGCCGQLQLSQPDSQQSLTATMLEHAIANSQDLWGLLQPYAHLNAGRLANGALAMPRWASVSSLGSSSVSSRSVGGGTAKEGLEQSLLTTCVGSMDELGELVSRLSQAGVGPAALSPRALEALFYYMRCSQLEHAQRARGAVQELAYERAYVVLPPLVEWLRVAQAHADHRRASIVDHDDVAQAARLLLPGVDCPVRPVLCEEARAMTRGGNRHDDSEYVRRLSLEMGLKLLVTGRPELIEQAMPLLPGPSKIDTVNEQGLTALMLASIAGDEAAVLGLLDAGADPNVETPTPSSSSAINSPSNKSLINSTNIHNNNQPSPGSSAETQHWTALTYAALLGHREIARLLLERGGSVEGGARPSEDNCTVTPLQAAAASGEPEMVALLLAHGAQPFLSTLCRDGFCYSGSAQRGCYSAISVAAAHGQAACLHQLLTHPLNFSARRGEKEVLSLEEILAEGSQPPPSHAAPLPNTPHDTLNFTKAQNKALQEAMYHSSESNHLDITMELRGLRVSWTLHCWMQSLSTAHEMRIDSVIDQLLQDFLQVCPDDYSTQFVQECLPLLFNIFRYSKKEGTTLLLADIFCTCFGWEPIRPIRDASLSNGSRIDPKFVNNPELSDVQFRVEGRVFYGHKIVLITSSPRFRSMLSSKLCEGNPPIVQINDIRYHIFQLVMEFLYHGGCATLEVNQSDVLELMAAANFFQLDGLLRFCEAQCSTMVDLDNIVSMYIHAKVYNALQLLEYCQGFLLQNMVALLTYDDSVKRLLFAKKLPNHDVLAGLLLTLQNRIKSRRPQIAK